MLSPVPDTKIYGGGGGDGCRAPTSIIDRGYLESETKLVDYLFLVYFVNSIYNLYMFRTSPGPSSGGTTVFMLLLTSQLYKITNTKCYINTFVPPDDGHEKVGNM
jgi:hypothetical protein